MRRAAAALLLALPACAPGGARPPAPAADPAPVVTGALGMEFVRIPPGSMVVGRFQPACPAREVEQHGDPRGWWTEEDFRRCEETVRRQSTPGFTVRIDRPYWIGRYEVTQGEWKRVMGSNPSTFQGERVQGDADRHPVESVTWEEVQRFVQRLNRMDPAARYRLPTEFEWEYAARAGAEGEPSWESIREQAHIQAADKGTTRPVGGKRPNAWGLYDTLGNVWEWVQDPYNGKLFPDPVPPRSGAVRVLRGGGFLSDVKNATPFTHAAGPGNGWDVGFRLVREPR